MHYPKGRDHRYPLIGGWVGLKAGLDTEARGKIFCLYWGSNPDRPDIQPIVRHYTDWLFKLHIYISKLHF
jgi:hypothetical protein